MILWNFLPPCFLSVRVNGTWLWLRASHFTLVHPRPHTSPPEHHQSTEAPASSHLPPLSQHDLPLLELLRGHPRCLRWLSSGSERLPVRFCEVAATTLQRLIHFSFSRLSPSTTPLLVSLPMVPLLGRPGFHSRGWGGGMRGTNSDRSVFTGRGRRDEGAEIELGKAEV